MPLPRHCDPIALHGAADQAVHLWHASLEFADWRSFLPLLSEEELHRADRFAFERDARRYVVSHAVLRTVLGRLAGISPERLAFRVEAGGKPILGNGSAELHFSLSRSEELVLIGVASRPLGVDLEWLATPMDVEALADTVFSPREHEAFGRIPPERRRAIFLRCWTRKEAILKATGQGLSIPPSEAEVLLLPGDAMEGQTILACLGSRWHVDAVLPRPGYVGAVAYALPESAS